MYVDELPQSPMSLPEAVEIMTTNPKWGRHKLHDEANDTYCDIGWLSHVVGIPDELLLVTCIDLDPFPDSATHVLQKITGIHEDHFDEIMGINDYADSFEQNCEALRLYADGDLDAAYSLVGLNEEDEYEPGCD